MTRRCNRPWIGARAVALALAIAAWCMPWQDATIGKAWAAEAESAAVILMYHRFGESGYPSTNIKMDQFEAHLEELRKQRYSVMPVSEIVAKVGRGEPLPDRTIGITIDDANASVYEKAWPRLRDAKLPFTLFVATDPVDRAAAGYMTWDQIRELSKAGVTIGSQTKSHPHLPTIPLEAVKRELDGPNARFATELGKRPLLFAYPFGEFNLDVRELVIDRGFKAAFGQHSGVVHTLLDGFALPRFALNERFGGIDRFRLIANALPLPVTDVLPADPVLGDNPPAFGFTVARGIARLDGLACFASSEGEVKLERLERRVEVRFREPCPPGRSRVNCTMPGPEDRWRWYGMQFVVPR
ncbi:MAG: polysaccharide deacetylase family protein [Alphaproteobacteria bacterium]|nr:polysaccharide deacetylase family protein [Alphaproteobacteria bacterium]